MNCPHCQLAAPPRAVYCVHCGAKLVVPAAAVAPAAVPPKAATKINLAFALSPKTVKDLRAAESSWCGVLFEEDLPKIVRLCCGPMLPGVGRGCLEQLALRCALVEIGAPAVPHLSAALRQPDLQAEAFSILGDMGAPAVPGLVGILGDDDLGPRAAVELNRIGSAAVPMLTQALGDARAAERAMFALANIGPAAIPAVEEWARQAGPDLIGRGARVLSQIGPPARASLRRLLADHGHDNQEIAAAGAELADDPRSTVLDLSTLTLAKRVEAVGRLPADVLSLLREIYPEHAGYRYRIGKFVWRTPRSTDEAQALDIRGKFAFGFRIALSPDPWCWSVDVGWLHRVFMWRLYARDGFLLAWRSLLLSLPVQWWFGIWPTWGEYWNGLLQILPALAAIGFVLSWLLHYGLTSRRLGRQALIIETLLSRKLKSSVVFVAQMRERLRRDGVAQALRAWGEEASGEWDEAAWTPAPDCAEVSRLRHLRLPPQASWRPWSITENQRFFLDLFLRAFIDAAIRAGERHPGRHAEVAASADFVRVALGSPHFLRPFHAGVFLEAADDRALVLELIGSLLLFHARTLELVYVAAGSQALAKARTTFMPLVALCEKNFDQRLKIRFQAWQETSIFSLGWKVLIYELDVDPDETKPVCDDFKGRAFIEKAVQGKCTWSVFLIQAGRQRVVRQSIEMGVLPPVGGID